MSLEAGTVEVDEDSGAVTYNPDNSTNAAKALYLLLLAASETDTTPDTEITQPVVELDPVTLAVTATPGNISTSHKTRAQKMQALAERYPDADISTESPSIPEKVAQAKVANTFASWIVPYLKLNAVVTTTIGITSDFDGLQDGTIAPPVAKILTGTIS